MITIEDLLRGWDDALADSLGFPYATVQRILTKAAIVQASGDCRKRGGGCGGVALSRVSIRTMYHGPARNCHGKTGRAHWPANSAGEMGGFHADDGP